MSRSHRVTSTEQFSRLELDFQDDAVFLNGSPIGSTIRLFKTNQPYEAQSRIAYDVFYETFFNLLARQHQIVAFHQTDFDVEIFVPQGRNLEFEDVWEETVAQLFGLENLRKTFIALVSSIRLTNRGFSALDVPIVTREQAQVLAAFDLVNLALWDFA